MNRIDIQDIVEHADTGEQGKVIGYSRHSLAIHKDRRFIVLWDNSEFATPGGVSESKLVLIRSNPIERHRLSTR